MFEGFELVRVATEGASISAVRGDVGPPVLLLVNAVLLNPLVLDTRQNSARVGEVKPDQLQQRYGA
jgi:hypothetical protein